MFLKLIRILLISGLMTSAPLATAQEISGPPYEGQLIKLAQILGSLHYLSNLCDDTSVQWREQMNTLLTAEKPDTARRNRLISAFNNSYRSYTDNYNSCTNQALKAIERFKSQGETLTEELLAQYGH